MVVNINKVKLGVSDCQSIEALLYKFRHVHKYNPFTYKEWLRIRDNLEHVIIGVISNNTHVRACDLIVDHVCLLAESVSIKSTTTCSRCIRRIVNANKTRSKYQ